MTHAFELDSVRKRFGLPAALRFGRVEPDVLGPLDLSLEQGGSLGLLGPNGSGKSTLLRLLAGIERPTSGRASLFGVSPDVPAARARIGYLSEATPFPPELRAREALELVATLHGLGRAERSRRVTAWLERVGLLTDANRALGRFSKGMQRRLGLAAAFLSEPELVLLDEPTAGLDAPGHRVLAEVLTEARARGAALVLASHHLEDSVRWTERVVVLLGGRVVADGTPRDVVGDRDRTLLEVADLSPDAMAWIEREIAGRGGRVLRSEPALEPLDSVYERLS